MTRWRLVWLLALVLLWILCTGPAYANALGDRLSQFPNWQAKPSVDAAVDDLVYPDWFQGEWIVTTTLVEMIAPLSPDIVTPGYDSNQDYLQQPLQFRARFLAQKPQVRASGFLRRLYRVDQSIPIVADRAFNGFNLTTAYFHQVLGDAGESMLQAVKVDPNNPNRQVTLLKGDRHLVSTITGRLSETPTDDQFIATEIALQVFQGTSQPYLNEVETTTLYVYSADKVPSITANQVTAIYLSPQDVNYFKANGRPVALYRYCLEFLPDGVPTFSERTDFSQLVLRQ